DILSDAQLQLCTALALPTITIDGMILLKRLTLISFSSIIRQVHYPVFPPQEDPNRVISWLEAHRSFV
ncbi:MAG: peroxiredoxin, partial [Nitrosomonadales bacterium]|nr:peroxiredoxin [Nitrosomonadales bacterium]